MIASPQQALAAAADAAARRGITPIVLSDRIEGEARDVAAVHAAIALQLSAGQFRVGDATVAPPAVLLSGGETTVTLSARARAGRGGRNSEFLLALAAHLDGAPGIAALACDTDGIDGTEDNAGAIVYPDTIARAAAKGSRSMRRSREHDSYRFFAADRRSRRDRPDPDQCQ